MAQFLRPISDITNTFASGGFADIDEVTFSDTDYAYGTNKENQELVCLLTDVSGTAPLVNTGHIVRWRQAQADSDAGTVAPSSGGANASYHVLLFQGTTQIAECQAITNTNEGSFLAGSYTLTEAEAGNITDYSDLRIDLFSDGSGGAPNSRRAAAFSWVEMEVPDAVAPLSGTVVCETLLGSDKLPSLSPDVTFLNNESSSRSQWTEPNTLGTISSSSIKRNGTYSLGTDNALNLGNDVYIDITGCTVGSDYIATIYGYRPDNVRFDANWEVISGGQGTDSPFDTPFEVWHKMQVVVSATSTTVRMQFNIGNTSNGGTSATYI